MGDVCGDIRILVNGRMGRYTTWAEKINYHYLRDGA